MPKEKAQCGGFIPARLTVDPLEYPLRYQNGEPCDTLHVRDTSGTFAWVPAGIPENAQLITALPELLAALKKIAETRDLGGLKVAKHCGGDMVCIARDALKKAGAL